MFHLFFLLLACLSTFVQAQTQAQIQSCANSIELISYEENPTWSTGDTTHYYNSTFTYDPVKCRSPSQVPVNRIYLSNLNSGSTYNCPKPAFDATGKLYSQCSQTLGFLATSAKNGDADLDYVDPPTPSGNLRRRRVYDQTTFTCPPGETYCPAKDGTFACINTASSLFTCGACPSDPNARDCSNIPGVNDVECRHSRCIVNSCLRGYQVSPDRKSCIRHVPKRR